MYVRHATDSIWLVRFLMHPSIPPLTPPAGSLSRYLPRSKVHLRLFLLLPSRKTFFPRNTGTDRTANFPSLFIFILILILILAGTVR